MCGQDMGLRGDVHPKPHHQPFSRGSLTFCPPPFFFFAEAQSFRPEVFSLSLDHYLSAPRGGLCPSFPIMGSQDFTRVKGRASDGVTLSSCLPSLRPLFPDLYKDRVGQDALGLGGLFNLQMSCLESSSLALYQTGDSWEQVGPG